MWLMGKSKFWVWVESELEEWEVRWVRSVLSHELEHRRNRNHECRKLASPTLAIAIADVMTGFTWLITFLGDTLLCSNVPDSFPRCGTGSGHMRLMQTVHAQWPGLNPRLFVASNGTSENRSCCSCQFTDKRAESEYYNESDVVLCIR